MNPVTNFEKWINSIATGTAPDIPPVTRFEHFLNRIRLAIARKGDIKSGLPDYTAEDKGKALTLASPTMRFTLVDEQTVTIDPETNMGSLAAGSFRLPDGESVIGKTGIIEATLTGTALSLTMEGTFAEVEGGTIVLDCEDDEDRSVAIAFNGEYAGAVVTSFDASEILVSAYMEAEDETTVVPTWGNGGNSEYIATFTVTYPDDPSAPVIVTCDKSNAEMCTNFNTLKAIVVNSTTGVSYIGNLYKVEDAETHNQYIGVTFIEATQWDITGYSIIWGENSWNFESIIVGNGG